MGHCPGEHGPSGVDIFHGDLNLPEAQGNVYDDEYEMPLYSPVYLQLIDPGSPPMNPQREYLQESPEPKTSALEVPLTDSPSMHPRAELKRRFEEANRYANGAKVHCTPDTSKKNKCGKCGIVGHNRRSCKQ
jgi:hypothetical protein